MYVGCLRVVWSCSCEGSVHACGYLHVGCLRVIWSCRCMAPSRSEGGRVISICRLGELSAGVAPLPHALLHDHQVSDCFMFTLSGWRHGC